MNGSLFLKPCLCSAVIASDPLSDPHSEGNSASVTLYHCELDIIDIIELLKPNQPSELQQTINNIAEWCNNHDLLSNASKTKALTFLNSRDDVIHPTLTINNTDIETVSDYKYLGTILNSRLKFTNSTNQVVKNTRKKLNIMKKLEHLRTSYQLRLNCYRTFIESSLLFHMTVIYHHMTDRDQQELAPVTRTAGKLAKQTFKLPNEVKAHRIHGG